MADRRLTLIEGGNQKRRYARKRKGDAEQWVCRVCEAETGTPTSVVVELRLAPMDRGGRLEGGNRVWACAHCWQRGKLTRVT